MSETGSRSAIAWAAGLFEGEGCIQYHINSLRLALTTTDADVIARFVFVVGHGHLHERKLQAAHHKASWEWWVHGHAAEEIYLLFRPHLGLRRRAAGDLALHRRRLLEREMTRIRQCPICRLIFRPQPGPGAKQCIYCTARCRRLAGQRKALTAVRPSGSD